MKEISILIAEDDQDAREIITAFIEPLSGFNIVGFAMNGEELLQEIIAKKPDLCLVDIRMPKLDGIEAARSAIEFSPSTRVVFITAYDHFAAEAFNLSAVDYIVKPIQRGRLYFALEKAKKAIVDEKENVRSNDKRLPIRFKHSNYYIPLADILFIEKIGRKSFVFTKKETYETYETLEEIKSNLDEYFFESHRSYIINLRYIIEITSKGDTYLAFFHHFDKHAHISKARLQKMKEQMSRLMLT